MSGWRQSFAACFLLATLGIASPSLAQDAEAEDLCWNYFTQAWSPNGSNWIHNQYQTEAAGVSARASAVPVQEFQRMNGVQWSGLVIISATATRNGGGDWQQGMPLFSCNLTWKTDHWEGNIADSLAGRIQQL
jgi:hypothetical protein